MIISKSFALSPSIVDAKEKIRELLLGYKSVEYGFILNVTDIYIKNVTISFTGNCVYKITANIETFLPKKDDVLGAKILLNKGNAYIAVAKDCLHVIFYSNLKFEKDATVKCILKEVKFQCGTYRAIAELIDE